MRSTINQMLSIQYGKSPAAVRDNDGIYPIYGTGGIVGRSRAALCSQPAIIIGRKGTIDQPRLVLDPFWPIDTTYYAVPKDGIDVRWAYYVLCNVDLGQYNEASGVPSLSRNTLHEVKVYIPPIWEQRRIAEILTACDRELDLLARKRDALRRQQRGLMQQILTGRIRVKV
jgi:type I restriction enzyme S subunit